MENETEVAESTEAAKAKPWAAIVYAKDRYQDLKTRGVL